MGDYWSFFTKGTLFTPFPGFKPSGKVPVVLFLFSWLFFFSSEAQDNFIFDHITTQNGLAGENVYCLLQDHNGFIWIGTGNGLNRYDGNEFLTYRSDRKNPHSLSNNTVIALQEDDKGDLWIATQGGLNRFNSSNSTFDHFIANPAGTNQLAANRISNIMLDSEKNLWIATEAGLFSFNPQQVNWSFFSADTSKAGSITSNKIHSNSLIEDSVRNGSWIATERGINFFDFKTHSFFNYLNNPHHWKVFDDHKLYGICVDHDGNIWYSDYGQLSICRFNPEKNELLRLTSIAGKPVTYACQFFFTDRENRLWFSAWTYRFFAMDLKTLNAEEIFHEEENPKSIISSNVKSILEDREGTLWLGTYSNISRYIPLLHEFQIYRLPVIDGKAPGTISAFYRAEDQNIYIGTLAGLYILNDANGTFQHIEYTATGSEKFFEPHYNEITSICEKNKDELWVGTRRDLLVFDKQHSSLRQATATEVPNSALHHSLITFMAYDHEKNFWIGTWDSGLFKVDVHGKWKVYNHTGQLHSLSANGLLCFLEDEKERIWVGLNGGGGLCRYRVETDDFEIFFSDATKENSLTYGVILCMAEDADGKIWIGTLGGGLNVFDPEKKIFKSFSQSDGIASDNIYSIVKDTLGDMWLATNLGITCFLRKENHFKNFDTDYGMRKNDFGEAIKTRRGTLLFSNEKSFIEIDPLKLKQNNFPPPIAITHEKIFDKEILLPDSSLALSYNQNFLSFEFTALSFVQSQKNRYAYFMKGVDRDWNYTDHHFASYPNLLPGNYVFEVKAANNDGVWNDHPAEMKIYIAPPWWQTWWFRSLLAIAGIALLWLGIREYTQRKLRKQKVEYEKLRAIEQERARISRDMHDELGSGLSTIRLLSEVAKQKLGDEKPTEEIDKIVNSSSELTEKMSEIVWALNSQNDTLESLIAYIRAYAMKYFDEIQLSCKVSLPEKIPSVNLSGEQRRNIFLCVKESLHNIVKHSGATQIEINFLMNETFRIEIHDNGKGVDLGNLRQFGNGLKNMQIRMETIGGSFSMKNEQGTTCTFTVPLLQ